MSTASKSSSPTIPETQIRPQPGPQTAFLASHADIAIYGGAAGGGKTWALLLEPLRHIHRPDFGAVFFRRESPQITNEGGLWDESAKLYPYAGGKPLTGNCEWHFGSGACISFRHLQYDKDRLTWQGAQVPLICFDELTHFEETQFWYLLSRNRSVCGIRPYVRASCNPDADSWVAVLLAWWINPETGLPIPERSGKVRWFVRDNDRLEWADTAAELATRFPGIPPKSLAFIPARLTDNQILMRADPGYLANLHALPSVERERLLGGNWKIRPSAGKIFNKAWFEVVGSAPTEAVRVRYWDKAATGDGGDWSCGVRLAKSRQGVYFVENVVRGRWSSLERNQIIRATAQADGHGVEIVIEQEPGSGGKESAEISVRELAGFIVKAERVTGDKETRARPLSAQCEARNVKIVAPFGYSWVGPFLDELHAFPTGAHDDQVDAASGAFNKLAQRSVGTGLCYGGEREVGAHRQPKDMYLPDREESGNAADIYRPFGGRP